MALDIMSMFRATPPAQGATPPSPVTGNNGQPMPGTAASSQTAPNGAVPANGGAAATTAVTTGEPASPLDKFADVWKTDSTQSNVPTGVFGQVDPQKILESAKKVNFAAAIPQEQLQAIAAGGEGAMQAFSSALNTVAQNLYAQSALASTKMIDQALLKAQESYDARIPTMVKKFSVSENLQNQNPILSNPALQPMVEALNEQFTRKHPNATSAEIQSMVTDYFSAVGNVFAPKPAETPTKGRSSDNVDWEAFMNS